MKPGSWSVLVTVAVAVGFSIGACTIVAGPPGPPPPAYPPQPYGTQPYGSQTYGAPPNGAARPPVRGTSETVVDEHGRSIVLEHGPTGDPSVIGCADGHREAFLDTQRYPAIAGCMGVWSGRQSLRAASTGAACGDELGPCGAPADVCAAGWHVCGSGGAVADLRQVSADDCEQAGGGRFAAAISHCKEQHDCAVDQSPEASYGCFPHGWCSEPVCCGRDCGQFGLCRDGVWPQHTHIPFGQDQGCASTGSERAGGVLCCRG